MDYPFSERNWICRTFGHRYGKPYQDQYGPGAGSVTRRTCPLDGHTVPPFRKLSQVRPYGYLPADQQPPGAV
jgi:hypothetical protein